MFIPVRIKKLSGWVVVDFHLEPVRYYLATHPDTTQKIKDAMRKRGLISGMNLEQAVATLGEPTQKSAYGDGREIVEWKKQLVRPSVQSGRSFNSNPSGGDGGVQNLYLWHAIIDDSGKLIDVTGP